MIITNINSGLGNQLFQYAAGRRLAHKLNTELKLDLSYFTSRSFRSYQLNEFSITASIATPEEVARIKELSKVYPDHQVIDNHRVPYVSRILTAPDDTYIRGDFQCEEYFADAADIIQKEFTLRKIGGERALYWLEKIRAAECSVSLHIRHGDYLYWRNLEYFGVLPIRYYHDCLNDLKKHHSRLTIFVFAENLAWAKEHFYFDIPTYFVEGCERASDDIFLMSQCHHNIIPNSSFSWWGAWLNKNPNKMVYAPQSWFRRWYHDKVERVPASWIKMPNDMERFPAIDVIPAISVIIHLNDSLDNIKSTFESLPAEKIYWLEFIIVNDSSDEKVGKKCRKISAGRSDIRPITLGKKIGRSTAWNLDIGMARGEYVLFLEGGDAIDVNRLHSTVFEQEYGRTFRGDVIHSGKSVTENELPLNRRVQKFASGEISSQLGTSVFRRNFLIENRIHFNEDIDDGAELFFMANCLLKLNRFTSVSNVFYTEHAVQTFRPRNFEQFSAQILELQKLMDNVSDDGTKKTIEKFFIERLWIDGVAER